MCILSTRVARSEGRTVGCGGCGGGLDGDLCVRKEFDRERSDVAGDTVLLPSAIGLLCRLFSLSLLFLRSFSFSLSLALAVASSHNTRSSLARRACSGGVIGTRNVDAGCCMLVENENEGGRESRLGAAVAVSLTTRDEGEDWVRVGELILIYSA